MLLISGKRYKTHKNGAILISGASTGIGKSAAKNLQNLGYTVYAGVRKQADADNLQKFCKELRPIFLDVTDQKSIQTAVERIERETQKDGIGLVGLINNAGISAGLPVELEQIDQVRRTFDVNVFGTYRLTQACIPLLRKSEGRIIVTGSMAGSVGRPCKNVYTSTAYSLEGFCDTLRLELAKWNISVSLLKPAFVKTSITSKQIGDKLPFLSLKQEDYAKYARYFDSFESKKLRQHSKGCTTEVTDRAFAHAITSPYPKTRYYVAKAKGVDAYWVSWILWILPDRVKDIVMQSSG